MLYAVLFLLGIIAARWLLEPLAALLRGAVFIASIAIAFRVAALVEPRINAINWRGFWSGAGIGVLVLIIGVGAWFYLLGWRGRVSATEAEDIDRARQKAIKDRALS